MTFNIPSTTVKSKYLKYLSEREVALIRTNPESVVKNKLFFSELILGDDYDYSSISRELDSSTVRLKL